MIDCSISRIRIDSLHRVDPRTLSVECFEVTELIPGAWPRKPCARRAQRGRDQDSPGCLELASTVWSYTELVFFPSVKLLIIIDESVIDDCTVDPRISGYFC